MHRWWSRRAWSKGFGLTVTEPMWKARPVVASRVGGIGDQIIDGQSGLLLDDPSDLDAFAAVVRGSSDDDARDAVWASPPRNGCATSSSATAI